MRCGLGLDMGGSSIKVGLVSQGGKVEAKDEVLVDTDDRDFLLTAVGEVIAKLSALADSERRQITAIGCGISGYLDSTGTRIDLNNIPCLNGFPLARWLEQHFGLPVTVDNDTCLAAFAEATLGRSENARRVLFVTVGSGIGVALVVDGAIVRIMHGVTGDAAHILVNHTSPERCPIGCRGCLETVASARAIARAGERAAIGNQSAFLASVHRSKGDIAAADVSAAAEGGDVTAQKILARAGHWLGIGLASWAPIYEPELVLVGGGVAEAGEAWLAAAIQAMRAYGDPFFVKNVVVRGAALGSRAGIIGAALLAMQGARRSS